MRIGAGIGGSRAGVVALLALAALAALGGDVATPVAQAGVKKTAKKAKKKAKKGVGSAAKKAKSAVGKGVQVTRKAAEEVAQKVTATAELLWRSFQKRFKFAEKTPRYAKGSFARFNPRASLDWTNAYLLAMASKVAYFNRAVAKEMMADLGLPAFTWINDRNQEAFVASDQRVVVVTLRGTEFHSFKDFLTDLDMFYVKMYGGKAHEGTHRAVSHIWPQILSAVKEHDPSGRKVLWVTGHSLGGNMALLTAKRLSTAGRKVHNIYTYGQFEVGNRIFDRDFKLPLHRIVNENDPVPYGPITFKIGDKKSNYFVHTGKLLFIDKKGGYRAGRRRTFKAEGSKLRLFRIVTGGLPQHSIDTYLTQVHKQLPAALKRTWPRPF